mgnify:CR=1 FL=1
MKRWVRENPKDDGTRYNINFDGLKIYTTIDSRMQKYAEEAMEEHMKKLQAEFFHQNTKKQIKNKMMEIFIKKHEVNID